MAADNQGAALTQLLQRRVLQQTLTSARYLLFFTVPPVLWAMFVAPPGTLRVIVVLLSGIIGYACWRLDLDARYFSVISPQNNMPAGQALFFIWRRERLRELSYTDRQYGALKQLRRTLALVAVLWGLWLLALFF